MVEHSDPDLMTMIIAPDDMCSLPSANQGVTLHVESEWCYFEKGDFRLD